MMWKKIKQFFSKLWSKVKPFAKYIIAFIVGIIGLLFLGRKREKSVSEEFSKQQEERNRQAEEANKIVKEAPSKANDIIEDYYNKKRDRGEN